MMERQDDYERAQPYPTRALSYRSQDRQQRRRPRVVVKVMLSRPHMVVSEFFGKNSLLYMFIVNFCNRRMPLGRIPEWQENTKVHCSASRNMELQVVPRSRSRRGASQPASVLRFDQSSYMYLIHVDHHH